MSRRRWFLVAIAALALGGGFAVYWELTGADQKELEQEIGRAHV